MKLMNKIRNRSMTVKQKILGIVVILIFLCIGFSFLLSYVMYNQLYVGGTKKNLTTIVENLLDEYNGEAITAEFIEKVDYINTKIFGVTGVVDIEKFSNHKPNELILEWFTEDRIKKLYNGEFLFYDDRNRPELEDKLTVVIYPLLSKGELIGFIYAYTPYNYLVEPIFLIATLWILIAIFFGCIIVYPCIKIVDKVVNPIKEMELAANRVSKGDYSTLIENYSNDEIGKCAEAFNKMSLAIREEDERKRDFLADVSHELRTPLSYVKGYSHALLDETVDTTNQKKYLKLIVRESNRMQSLIQDLMDLIKMEKKIYSIDLNPIVLSQIVEESMEKFQTKLREKNLTLVMKLDPEIIINGDDCRIEQIVQNIVENAIRYSKVNGKIMIFLEEKENDVYLSIVDNGIGISEDDIKKVTERFYRVNKARSRFNGGTGLGLSIVEKLMILHHGKMEISSKLNMWTKVNLIFPKMEIEEDEFLTG
ncbi:MULTISPECIES: HAMP domain-containing sensor histidine kinase [Bacillus]|uniref:HAMP domain-containing sensor histidine kinase n=1 Tax=Bacillus TaxID=1386 RepID=UPI0002DD769D|nr:MULTISPECIES: HAMP domain-containing sensor histidine kinase [Bacillus]